MLTIFSTAKPFRGLAKIHQLNSLHNWKMIHPEVEVILFGRDEGTAETCETYGIRHIPDVQCSSQGTPLVSSMLEIAARVGRYDVQCFTTCDILFTGNVSEAIASVPFPRYAMVGRRLNLDIPELVDFSIPDALANLWKRWLDMGCEGAGTAADYFVYSRGIWKDLPSLTAGRAGYDNYMLYYCKSNRIPMIEATEILRPIHQKHGHEHCKGGSVEVWNGPEAQMNYRAIPDGGRAFFPSDSDWVFRREGLRRNFCKGNLLRYVENMCVLRPENRSARFCLIVASLFKRVIGRVKRIFSLCRG